MRRGRLTPTIIFAASVCVTVALPGCSAASPAAESAPATRPFPATTVSATDATLAFTIAGSHPVLPNGSQDTHAQTSATVCDSTKFAADKTLGAELVRGFKLAGLPVSADLLTHFLRGKGTVVSYPAGSMISKEALASSAFRTVNNEVRQAVFSQLKAGTTRVRLFARQLPTVAFESATSDLYWGFRGTQGLTVTGSGSREHGSYVGTISYVIRDSYGFPVGDTLAGFGAPMRYLQTVCGAPEQTGGAHWFPDTITVTVPFHEPP